MNLKPIIDEEEIKELNRRFGGNIRYDSSISFAIEAGRGKFIYRKIALFLRSIAVQHPFTDANKRTALAVALLAAERSGIKIADGSAGRISKITKKIAETNEENTGKIERWVRYAFEGR
jgi:death-on-curing family protein